MSNTNNNLETQTSNALQNAIMETCGPSTNNPPYKFKWTEKTVPVTKGSSKTTIEWYMENYKNVSQDVSDQLNAKAEAVQIILIGIDNDIYSIVDACPNACEMWKAIERSQQATKNRGKAIVNSFDPIYDQEPATITEDDEMSKEKEIDKLMALISLSFNKIYKPTNNNLQTSSNTSRANQDNSPRINRGTRYENHRVVNVAGARENVGTQLNAEKVDWKDDINDESDDQELEAHCMYMTQIQEVSPDAADNSGPIFNSEPLQKVQNNDHNYNVFAIENDHPEQPEYVNDTYLGEQDLKKFQAELDRYHDVNYASKINDLNKTILNMKKELFAHQETISIMSQEKEAQIKFYKTREDKELDKVIALENKVKVLDDIVYKTIQSVQTMNMLNRNCKTSFAKPEFLKKDKRANPRLYDIGCYNDNLALMLAPESDKTIRLAKEI
ncbi:hypothetical protein Tco_1407401 [Tanacetum coccineum]